MFRGLIFLSTLIYPLESVNAREVQLISQEYGSGQFDFSYEKEPEGLPDGAEETKLLVIENDRKSGISPKRAFFDQNSIDTFESISLQMLSFSQRKNLYSAHLIKSTKKRKNLKLISCRIR